MVVKFLGQGFDPVSENAVGKLLINLFADIAYQKFIGISAFASQSGIRGLAHFIDSAKDHLDSLTIIVGVDQKGTSKEALEQLLALEIEAYVFYQPSRSIFHPKIYLFEGTEKSELIVGSSNATSQGLFTNVEASLLVSIDNKIDEDREVVDHLKEYFSGLFDFTDPNLQRLTPELIEELVEAKVVPTEAERKEAQDKSSESESEGFEAVLGKIFPKRAVARIPREFRGPRKSTPGDTGDEITAEEEASDRGELVWTRKSLPSSSVQGGGSGTNPTGGLRLVQDDFKIGGLRIDHTTYFRNDLFGGYAWKEVRTVPFVEAAVIPFEVTIKDEFKGTFDLEVRHKPSGEAGQHNYTTSISWGILGEIIKDLDLVNSRLDLYAPVEEGDPFHIVIS